MPSRDTKRSRKERAFANQEDGDSDEGESDSDDGTNRGTGVSLSGLLNAIDGIGAAEGRLFFCTTNHLGRIDPALSRPGECTAVRRCAAC